MDIIQLLKIFLIALGAIIGANIRYFFLRKLEILKYSEYRLLTINLFSSFILGLLFPFFIKTNLKIEEELIFLFLFTFIGSLSSFSTFISDFYLLILNNNLKRSTLLIFFSIVLGILFFNFGYLIISN
tara:strand:+ start:562 stop:945 length:384 start_codon:yes stop_codon:yes gene_type:complete